MPPESGDAPLPAQPVELSGTTIDRYKLETLLGVGGMGRVYSAVHTVTRRRCALKLLPDDLCKNPDFVARFQAEAQTLARLNHPHIVQIYSGGEAASRFFLEMEYIDGGDLQKRVTEQSLTSNKGLAEGEAVRVTEGILAALEYAHGHGIIHRDLKPANILLSKDGAVKVSDFGLASVIGEDLHRSLVQTSLTSFSLAKVTSMETIAATPTAGSAAFVGTILYMSPQALRSEPADARDDLFSLGVVIYYMLTGRTPAVNFTPVSRIRPDLKLKWDPFIATCLAEDRNDRFANASAAKVAFSELSHPRSKKSLLIALGAALVLVPAVVLMASHYSKSVSPELPILDISGKKPADNRPTIRFDPIQDVLVTAPPTELHATATDGQPVEFAVVSGPAQIEKSTLRVIGPGIVTVRALQKGDEKHLAATPVERSFRALENTLVASRKTQSLVLEPVPESIVGGPPIELDARADSGLPIRFSLVSGPAKLRGNLLTPTGPGKITVRAEQSGNAEFLPASLVEQTFTVQEFLPGKLTVTLPGEIEMTFVKVPAGRAMLGSPDGEMGGTQYEGQHDFVEPEGFLMGATEVTQAQFEAITGERPSYFRSEWKNRPVEQVRWSELSNGNTGATVGFFPKLNAFLREHELERWEAMLPSEDQWEYACRAGSATAFNNNVDLSVPIAIGKVDQIAVFEKSETSPVASHAPNPWGLYDMHGNVAEWTREGVLRGGSFRDDVSGIRSAARVLRQSGNPNPDKRFGFRVILVARRGGTP